MPRFCACIPSSSRAQNTEENINYEYVETHFSRATKKQNQVKKSSRHAHTKLSARVEKTENKRTMQEEEEEEEETETENEQQQLKEQFKDQGTTNATTKSEKKMGNCRVCEEQEGKYRCPKCLLISCSLQCVNVHKEKFNCDGKRDRFQYVNLKEMEDKHVTDFRFLEEATEVLDRAKRKRISMMSTSGRSGVLIGNNNNNNNNRKRKRNNGNKKNKNNKNNNSFDKKNGDPEVKKLVVGIAPEAPAV